MQFKSTNSNRYYYSDEQETFILCHPILAHLIQLKSSDVDVEDWMTNVSRKGIHLETKHFSKNDVHYYFKKFQLLLRSGYFKKTEKNNSREGRICAGDVESQIVNCDQILFEITEGCNLNCTYCGYGHLYDNYDSRNGKNMDFKLAKNLIDFLHSYWKAEPEKRNNKTIHVGFYGGEPLLNFDLIKDIVNYMENLPSIGHIHFSYGMTTNGMLIDKYIDFISNKNMDVLVSLDGGQNENALRLQAKGKPSFGCIMKNLKIIANRFPDFFENNISFNTVVHSGNSILDIYSFFKSHFNKIPMIAEINPSGIKKSKQKEFEKIYSDLDKTLDDLEENGDIDWKHPMYFSFPKPIERFRALLKFNKYSYENYSNLVFSDKKPTKIPTGTCLPFARKIFLTVNGKILPCERIGYQYYLGIVGDRPFTLNYEKIAARYNSLFDKISRLCQNCAFIKNCNECLFYWEEQNIENGRCPAFEKSSKLSGFLAEQISYVENKSDLLSNFLREIHLSRKKRNPGFILNLFITIETLHSLRNTCFLTKMT